MRKLLLATTILFAGIGSAIGAPAPSVEDAYNICVSHWGVGHPACAELQKQYRQKDRYASLVDAYNDYTILKICYELRQGYDFVFISDNEMSKAKRYVAGIEKKSTLPDKDGLWEEYQAELQKQGLLTTIRNRANRPYCQQHYKRLQADYNELSQPGIKKDF
jgi:hypothetical protein